MLLSLFAMSEMRDRTAAGGAGNGSNPLPVYLDPDGALEQAYRNHQPVLTLRLNQNPLKSCQRAALDQHAISDLEKRPRHERKTGGQKRTNRFELRFIDRLRNASGADYSYHPGNGENWKPAVEWKLTEDIACKQRNIELFHPVRPPRPLAIQREELRVALVSEGHLHDLLVI